MKVLWFSPTPSLFVPQSNSHNGGGWVASLEQIVSKADDIRLGVAFEYGSDNKKYERGSTSYYIINNQKKVWQRSSDYERVKIKRCLEIIEDYKPDLIQIFGSENYFGQLCKLTSVPVVIHIQGSMPPYLNAIYPQGMNRYDFLFTRGLSWRYRFMGWRSESSFGRNSKMEIETFKSCMYFMGRTDWDNNLVKLYHPEALYYHVEEALRDSFWNDGKIWRHNENRTTVSLISVISNPWYKGYDLILKTAKLLKEECGLDFEWKVYGFRNALFFEKKYKIESKQVNVKVMGVVNKEDLVDALCSSDCYIHPSYIDNSPNSLCEAQILGVPVIATNVGGVSSNVEDGITGLLVPANDPFTLAIKLIELLADSAKMNALSSQARSKALIRHNPDAIRESLLSVYKDILCKHNR